MTLDSISVTERSLIFDYTVNNYSPFPVYLFNILGQTSKSVEKPVESNLVYAWFENRTTLSLAKQLLVAPNDVDAEDRFIPFVSSLASGWTLTETLQLPLPIQLNQPYATTVPGSQKVSVTQFTFTLGYIIGDTPIQTEQLPLLGGRHLSRPYYQDGIERQRLKQSRPVMATIPIKGQGWG